VGVLTPKTRTGLSALVLATLALVACGGSSGNGATGAQPDSGTSASGDDDSSNSNGDDGSGDDTNGADAGRADASAGDASTHDGGTNDGGDGGGSISDGGTADGGGKGGSDAGATDTLASNRLRLLTSYDSYLHQYASTAQSNGLSSSVGGVCDILAKLDPSSIAVFDTITTRLQGSTLRDGSSMLWHITKVYRITGGQGATATDPGTCGGGEFNRMIMSMDAQLQQTLVEANADLGAQASDGTYDIADIDSGSDSFWRDSHDLGGPHAPFDLSDETDNGAPRGQVQYFTDPTSSLANSPLGREDLTSLVDPYAIEMDEDYDCPHNSNPLCSYTFYGDLCFPESTTLGLDLFTKRYGDVDASWANAMCSGSP
jgi:hypothetical protein